MRGVETVQVLVIKPGEFLFAVGVVLDAGGNALVGGIDDIQYLVGVEIACGHYAGDVYLFHIGKPFRVG